MVKMKCTLLVLLVVFSGCTTRDVVSTSPQRDQAIPDPRATYIMQGEVMQPGAYPLPSGLGVLNAIAAAGGLTDYAAGTVTIVGNRQQTFHARIRDVERGKTADPRVEDGDVILIMRH